MCTDTTEQNVRFTVDFTTIYTSASPLKSQTQPVPPTTNTPPTATQLPLLPTPQTQTPQMQQPPQWPQPLPATDSGEEEIEVKDKLIEEDLPLPQATTHKGKATTKKGPPP